MAGTYRIGGMGIPACAGMTVKGYGMRGVMAIDVQDEWDGDAVNANRHSGASRNLLSSDITVTEPSTIDSGLRRNDGWGGGMTKIKPG